jgi:hypothetical protein
MDWSDMPDMEQLNIEQRCWPLAQPPCIGTRS